MKTAKLTQEELEALNEVSDWGDRDPARMSVLMGFLACKYGLATMQDLVMPHFTFMIQRDLIVAMTKDEKGKRMPDHSVTKE